MSSVRFMLPGERVALFLAPALLWVNKKLDGAIPPLRFALKVKGNPANVYFEYGEYGV